MAEFAQSEKKDMIEVLSQIFQTLGMPKTTGLVFGVLFLSPKALTLEQICEEVLISKGSASTGTRKLLEIKAIETSWVRGDRRPHFQCVDDTPLVFASVLRDFLENRLGGATMWASLEIDSGKDRSGPKGDEEFYRTRGRNLLKFRERLRKAGPLIEEFLKKS